MKKQKIKKIFAIVSIAVFLMGNNSALQAPALAQEPLIQEADEGEFVSGEMVIKLSEGVELEKTSGSEQLAEIVKDNGLEQKEIAVQDNVVVLKTKDASQSVAEKIDELAGDPRVEYAQPNFIYHSLGIISNDPNGALQWALDNVGQSVNGVAGSANADINAGEAWAVSQGNTTPPIVAIIDDGVAHSHPDLVANMWDGSACVGDDGSAWGGCLHGYDFFANDKNPMEEGADTHGTVIAGIVGASRDNGIGGMGIAPYAKIMALRIGSGETFTTDKALRAIAFAKNNGAKIINASWGGSQSDLLLKNAIESFNGLFITSAGNSGSDNDAAPIYPCSFDSPNIICVAATDQHDGLWAGSDFGALSVDLGAPGTNIFSTANNGGSGYAFGEGTSMATPFVGGVAALLWGRDASLTAAQVKATILQTGDSLAALAGKTLTGKRLNAFAALGGAGGISFPLADPFGASDTGFSSKDVQKGKAKKTKIKLNFANVQNAAQFLVSRRADFAGAAWQPAKGSVNVSLKAKGKAETFYVKFRDTNGTESRVFKNKVRYAKPSVRSIKSSRSKVKAGEVLIQRGKGFAKKSPVMLFFGSTSKKIQTDARGGFLLPFKVSQTPGSYSWHALDLKTGKKSKSVTYKVVR